MSTRIVYVELLLTPTFREKPLASAEPRAQILHPVASGISFIHHISHRVEVQYRDWFVVVVTCRSTKTFVVVIVLVVEEGVWKHDVDAAKDASKDTVEETFDDAESSSTEKQANDASSHTRQDAE